MKDRRAFLLVFVVLLGGCAGTTPPARIQSVPDAKQALARHGWNIEEFGGGTRLFASRRVLDKDKAMRAFGQGIRGDLDSTVLIAPVDSGNLLPSVVSRQFDDVWILGEATDVDMCVKDLRR